MCLATASVSYFAPSAAYDSDTNPKQFAIALLRTSARQIDALRDLVEQSRLTRKTQDLNIALLIMMLGTSMATLDRVMRLSDRELQPTATC